jgi:dTDP-4-dehydrorhamnose reductase
MKILLTGGSGQLGKSIIKLKPLNIDLITPDRSKLDLSKTESCIKFVKKEKPDWIINCGAFTNVDKAESEKENVFLINHEAPKNFSKVLSDYGGKLLHISSDYVFDGCKNKPYLTNDKVNPQNVYGYSKALAEQSIKEILTEKNSYSILRTSWVVSPIGNNFLLTMIKLMKRNNDIRVVNDQLGSMTSTLNLAKSCWLLISANEKYTLKNLEFPPIQHWCDEGIISWYKLAIEIRRITKEKNFIKNPAKIKPISSNDYKFVANRPKYSVLNCTETEKLLKIKRIYWKTSLFSILNTIFSK